MLFVYFSLLSQRALTYKSCSTDFCLYSAWLHHYQTHCSNWPHRISLLGATRQRTHSHLPLLNDHVLSSLNHDSLRNLQRPFRQRRMKPLFHYHPSVLELCSRQRVNCWLMDQTRVNHIICHSQVFLWAWITFIFDLISSVQGSNHHACTIFFLQQGLQLGNDWTSW